MQLCTCAYPVPSNSYGLAPQSLLASLESVQFVTNIIFGKFMLGTTITRRMYTGTGLIVFGTILAVASCPQNNASFGPERLLALYGKVH